MSRDQLKKSEHRTRIAGVVRAFHRHPLKLTPDEVDGIYGPLATDLGIQLGAAALAELRHDPPGTPDEFASRVCRLGEFGERGGMYDDVFEIVVARFERLAPKHS